MLRRATMRFLLVSTLIALLILTAACGSNLTNAPTNGAPPAAGLSALPADGVQPWEQVDSRGFVIPPVGRGASAFDPASYFQTGSERFQDGGNAVDNGDALTLESEAGAVGYAIYRFPMGGE